MWERVLGVPCAETMSGNVPGTMVLDGTCSAFFLLPALKFKACCSVLSRICDFPFTRTKRPLIRVTIHAQNQSLDSKGELRVGGVNCREASEVYFRVWDSSQGSTLFSEGLSHAIGQQAEFLFHDTGDRYEHWTAAW